MNNTIEIILNDEFILDVNNDTKLGLIYQVADVREFENRKSSYTYPFTLPGSHNNNEAFGFIYNINNDTQFDPNIRAKVTININSATILSGYLQLNSISIDNDSNKITYEVTIFSGFVNLFDVIADRTLCQLNMSEWNHQYTKENVVGSWDEFVIKDDTKINFQLGRGYVYPYVNYNDKYALRLGPAINPGNPFDQKLGPGQTNNNNLNTEFFLPHPYAKTILDRIFFEANFTYTSKFLTSNLFKSLIVSPNPDGLKLDRETTNLIDFKAKSYFEAGCVNPGNVLNEVCWDAGQLYIGEYNGPLNRTTGDKFIESAVQRYPFNVDIDTINDPPTYFDFGNNYNILTHTYTVPEKVTMIFRANMKFKLVYGEGRPVFGNIGVNTHIGEEELWFYLRMKRNGVTSTIDSIAVKTPINYTQVLNGPVRFRNASLSSPDMIFLEGDEVWVDWVIRWKVVSTNALGQAINGRVWIWYLESDFSANVTNNLVKEGNDIIFSNLLFCDSQASFITSLAKMFNLYILPNPDLDGDFIIEPRDDFYNTGNVIDWSGKLDRKSFTTQPIPEVLTSKVFLQYSQDNDFLNNDYQGKFKDETYGLYESDFRNDWELGDARTTITFAPSPLISEDGTDRIITSIWKEVSNELAYASPKMRILYYGGLVNTNSPYWIYSTEDSSGDYNTFSQYAYAGHIDSPERVPSLDLSFSWPKLFYYPATQFTPNSLYNLYWRNTFTNIYDKNAKLLTGQFYLTEKDIQQLNLRDYIFLDGLYWYINKVDGYNPLTTSLTTVELVSIINQNTSTNFYIDETLQGFPPTGDGSIPPHWTPVQVNPNLPYRPIQLGPTIPPPGLPGSSWIDLVINSQLIGIDRNNINSTSITNTIIGINNNINDGVNSTIVSGNGNNIGNSNNSMVSGDNNTLENINHSLLFVDDLFGLSYLDSTYGASGPDIGTMSSATPSISFDYMLVVGTGGSYSYATFQDIINAANAPSIGEVLYFNNSIPSTVGGVQQLSPDYSILPQSIISVTGSSGTASMGTFITDTDYPGQYSIQGGIWDLNIWASINNIHNSYLYYEVYTYDSALITPEVLISTSGLVPFTSTSITQYSISTNIPKINITPLIRIYIKLYAHTNSSKNISYYFEDNTMTHIHTSLNNSGGGGGTTSCCPLTEVLNVGNTMSITTTQSGRFVGVMDNGTATASIGFNTSTGNGSILLDTYNGQNILLRSGTTSVINVSGNLINMANTNGLASVSSFVNIHRNEINLNVTNSSAYNSINSGTILNLQEGTFSLYSSSLNQGASSIIGGTSGIITSVGTQSISRIDSTFMFDFLGAFGAGALRNFERKTESDTSSTITDTNQATDIYQSYNNIVHNLVDNTTNYSLTQALDITATEPYRLEYVETLTGLTSSIIIESSIGAPILRSILDDGLNVYESYVSVATNAIYLNTTGDLNLDVVGSLNINGNVGVTGTFSNPTSITVVNGIITAIS